MDRLRTDLRYATRLLMRSPAWTAIAVLSLALGIGANAVVFSLVDAVLLEPFPYRDSSQLVLLWGSKAENQTTGISGADMNDWRAQSRSFEDIDAFLGGDMKFSLGSSEADRVQGACIGHRVLPMLGTQPARGRNFTEEEATYGAAPVVLVSDALWRSRYASDPDLVGRTIRLGDRQHEVIGIMPAGFFFPDTDARLWVPAPCGLQGFEQRGSMTLNAIGRLRAGVSIAQAQADLDRINRALAEAFPETNRNRTTGVFALRRIVIGRYEQALWTLVWAIALVLLIACANVVHLQLARGVDREVELAVRGASGAGRPRLLRQLLTESLLLVAISAVARRFRRVDWRAADPRLRADGYPAHGARAPRRARAALHGRGRRRHRDPVEPLAGVESVRRPHQRDAEARRDGDDGRVAKPAPRSARRHGDRCRRHAAGGVRPRRQELRADQPRRMGLQSREASAHRCRSCRSDYGESGSRVETGD